MATLAFGVETCERLAQGQTVEVWGLDGDMSVRLSVNTICRREWFWALGLYTSAGLRLCQLSFSLGHPSVAWVGSVQGAAANDEAAQQGVRDATRLAYGLRPPYLLAEVLRAMCRAWGLGLEGMDPCHHVKRRWYHRELMVAFDYRAFWSELGGQPLEDGSWQLPVQRAERDLQDVPAKRRAMYRRRQAALEAMPAQIMAVSHHELPQQVLPQRRAAVQRTEPTAGRRPPKQVAMWVAYLVGAAVALTSLFAAVWTHDLFAPRGERTIYTANCVGGDWVGDRCSGEVVAGPRLRFRALRAHRQVMSWTVGGSEPVQVLWNCEVTDASNWTCPTPADMNNKRVLEMRDGRAYYRWVELEAVPDMSKLRWLFSRG